ncbi:MAG: hypothetical protein EXR68_05370 [Dehalococcoidia bacterium]|nr:hypothetical protein [Dehalococcoidia bacterium]
MPKQSPVPNALDKPFWDACNEDRLVLQHCDACGRFQHPPEATCASCGSAERLVWQPVSGRGTVYSYGVVYDTPIASLQGDQPYNVAVIDLDDAPGINMLSHLPGTPVDKVPIGASVRLMFEATPATGQKVPEWQVAG